MKTIIFKNDEESKNRFAVVYQGFIGGASELKGVEANRRAFRIMDKISEISVVLTNDEGRELTYQSGDPVRTLKEIAEGESLPLALEEAEWTALSGFLANVSWSPRMSKTYVLLIDEVQAQKEG